MNVKWLIEAGMFPEEVTANIEKSLEEIDVDYRIKLDVVDYAKSSLLSNKNSFYIPYGSVGMVRDLQNLVRGDLSQWGIWYDPNKLSFGALSANWGRYLFNHEHVVTTMADLYRRVSYFYNLMGTVVDNKNIIFIKPFLNDKSFNGMILMSMTAEGTLEKIINDDWDFGRVRPETLVVIARPRMAINEWRLFILDGNIIGATQYNKCRQKHYAEVGPVDGESKRLIANVLADPWQPDLAYSLDICQAEDRHYYVMEIGCINCSDLYAVNTVEFFGAMTKYFELIEET